MSLLTYEKRAHDMIILRSFSIFPTGNKMRTSHKCSDDADAPDAYEVADKGEYGFAHALQHTFGDDGDAVEGLQDSDHTQNRSAEQDNFGIENADWHGLQI